MVGSGAVHAPHREPVAKGREEGSYEGSVALQSHKVAKAERKGGGRGSGLSTKD